MILKIIHTADWHLGKILNGHSFLEDQKVVLKQFLDDVQQEKPNLIIIAGDIYDTSYPNKETVTLMEETISKLNLQFNVPIIIISGNHDSKRRLSYGASWFMQNNLFIRTELEDFFKPIQFNDFHFYTLPFFTISEVKSFFSKEIGSYEEAVRLLIEHLKSQMDMSKTNVLIGHFTVYGAPKSDSEREITIGTIESVEPSILEEFDLVLLGHIHHPFTLSADHIFYSGSILQYSFSETKQVKGYRIFNLKNKAYSQQFKMLEPRHELEVIEGRYTDIINGEFARKSNDSYFHFKLMELSQITEPMQKLKQAYPNTLALTPYAIDTQDSIQKVQNIKKLKTSEIVEDFYEKMMDTPLSNVQKSNLNQILNDMEEN